MKKYIRYIAILIVGLIAGWLIFGGDNSDSKETKSVKNNNSTEEIWTCSMHPQIRLPEPGDCPICGMDLIPLEANGNTNPLVFEMTEDAMKIANIQTTVIGASTNDKNVLKLSGKIKADETVSASIVSHVAGRIEKLFVSYTGEKVNRGQKIASVYSPKLITAQKELLEAYKVKNVNPKLYEATVNKLKYWKITDNQIQTIINSSNVIESFNIYAEHSGVVSKKRVSVGDYLNEGEVLFDIQNLDKLWAVFDVYETDLANIKEGITISFSTPSLPNKTFKSTIDFIDPVINPSTRVANIRTSIYNSGNSLKPEMFLEGTVFKKNGNNESVSVPKTAVLWTGERSVVYVKIPDLKMPSFEFREVTLGQSLGKNYIVLDGIANGDEVVTNGSFVIDASAQLNNQSSMMNRNLLSTNSVDGAESLTDFTSQTPLAFKQQLGTVLNNYLALKNSLVNSNTSTTRDNGKQLIANLGKVDMSLVKGEAHIYWMSQVDIIKQNTEKLVATKDLKKQRDVFITLSNSIINVTKAFGVEKGKYYVQFCPMAQDNKGAFWLSTDKSIKNPYYGDEMLTCGSNKETITKDFKIKSNKVSNNSSPMSGHNH
tara:strand:- start:1877 stop:3673 length:1797 start_codon:yes stop_codon:yes gene_type:complete